MARKGIFESIVDTVTGRWRKERPETTPSEQTSEIEARDPRELQKLVQYLTTMGLVIPITGRTDTMPIGTSWDWLQKQLKVENTRRARYADYDEMDNDDPIINRALNVYADSAVQADTEDESIITFFADSEKLVQLLEEHRDATGMNAEAWKLARGLAKYGDAFDEIVVKGNDIVKVKPLVPEEIRRNEDEFGNLLDPAFTQVDPSTLQVIAQFKDWQIVHYRTGRDRGDKYGHKGSVLASIRRTYKQLMMLEDGLILTRLVRAPQRYKWKIDTTGIDDPMERLEYLKRVREEVKRQSVFGPDGRLRLEPDPLSQEEDVFVAVTQGSPADVDVLQGQTGLGDIRDVEYFQNKLLSALPPKAYLGLERDINAKATLTQQDVQFARSVRRIQWAMVTGYKQRCDLFLTLRGVSPRLNPYTIVLPAPSVVDELQRWQAELVRASTANMMRNAGISLEYMLKYVYGLSDEDIERIKSENEALQDLMKKTPEEAKNERGIDKRTENLLKMALGNELQALVELVDWHMESKTGRGLLSMRKVG